MSQTLAAHAEAAGGADRRAGDRTIRRIGIDDIAEVLRLGWRDFLTRPSGILFLFIVYPVIGVAATFIAFSYDLVGMIYPLMAGFALVGPIAAVGTFELSRRIEAGEDPRVTDALAVLRDRRFWPVAAVSLLLVLLFAGWIAAAQTIEAMTLGVNARVSLAAFLGLALTTPAGLAMFAIGNAVGFLFAVVALSIAVVSLPMLVDGEPSAARAIATSVRAVVANPVPMAAWGLTVAVLLALGSLPVFAGLLIVLPVLGHANWHLYRRVIAH